MTRTIGRIRGEPMALASCRWEERLQDPLAVDARTNCMSDNPETTKYKDRDKINSLDESDLNRQAKELGVTPEVLKDTANRVGVLKEDVKKQLGK
jgi:hypothetical protein